MRLLVTGASGFFGSNLIDLLLDRSADGVAPPAPPPDELHTVQRRPGVDRTGVVGHQVDLFDRSAVTELIDRIRPTHLCHMAWLGPEAEDRYRSPENQRWAEASKHLFDAFDRAGGERLVHLGSCIEYGNSASGKRVEGQPLVPDTAYGAAKAELSEHLLALKSDLSIAIARPFFAYGPHEQPDRLVPSLILALHQGRTIDLTEGRQRRDYIDGRDVAAALIALLRADSSGPFNIGSGVAVEVRSIAEQLGRIAGRPELLNFGGRPEGADTAAEILADIDRITAATGWTPTIGLERGLQETTDWWLRRIDTPSSGGGNR
ncbi:MAG: NAD-dependent epimerase/dehydratase family protein [Acidimicrobiales bacterium]